jgi:dCTP diphosphatase
MHDATTTIFQLKEKMRQFVTERDWDQFHAPKNLAMSVAIEAAELMEHFQWMSVEESRDITQPAKREAIGEELADVLSYCLALANALNFDISQIVTDKMVKNALKYPVEQYRGKSGQV